MLSTLADQLSSELAALRTASRFRVCPEATRSNATTIRVNQRDLISFSSNDYLGLAFHPAVKAASNQSTSSSGFGSTASRLVTGTLPEHTALERGLASFLSSQSVLLFSSGYQANIGLLTALADARDLIVADHLVHASLLDGCRLSRAKLAPYPHLNLRAAERHLANLGPRYRRRFLVTESVFSMDGDLAPLPALSSLASAYDASLVVDEAHAIGILGPSGRGLCALHGIIPDVLIGTLGKAFGCLGAFVSGDSLLHDYLVNRARSFLYTTAPPPSCAAAASAALSIIRSSDGDVLRQRLYTNISRLHSAFPTHSQPALVPILPILLGTDHAAIQASANLEASGFFLQPIRPPTVPEGTARLRITLSASHCQAQIDSLAFALKQILPPS